MQDLTLLLERALKIYTPMENYVAPPIPCELDEAVGDLVNGYIQASPSERRLILSKTNGDCSFMFIIFAERMAALGVREKSRQRLLEGLVALLIEGFKFDWRDTLTRFAPLYHSATKIGVEPVSLFNEASSYAENDVAKAMAEFPARKSEDRSLKAFMYKEIDAPDGFRYEVG